VTRSISECFRDVVHNSLLYKSTLCSVDVFFMSNISDSNHTIDSDAQLAHLHQSLVFWGTLSRKVSHTDLAVGVQSEFIGRSVHARLQVSVCTGYNLLHPG